MTPQEHYCLEDIVTRVNGGDYIPIGETRNCMLSYGSKNKAWITLNKGQIWELRALPSSHFPWYSLLRYSVTIDIVEEDFKKIFQECIDRHLGKEQTDATLD